MSDKMTTDERTSEERIEDLEILLDAAKSGCSERDKIINEKEKENQELKAEIKRLEVIKVAALKVCDKIDSQSMITWVDHDYETLRSKLT